MRFRVLPLATVLLAAFVTPLLAARPTPRVEALLGESSSPGDLRARLFAYADSLGTKTATAGFMAGDAWFYAGVSFDRGGKGDSAIWCYERAIATRNSAEERRAMAAALCRRQGPGDVKRAQSILRGLLNEPGAGDVIVGEMAWATFLAGQPDSAAKWFATSEHTLSSDLEWRYRMGEVALEQRDNKKAFRLLFPLAVLSYKQDVDVMDMLKRAATDAIQPEKVAEEVDRGIRSREIGESKVLQAMGAKPVKLAGHDGFPLGAMIVAGSSKKTQRAVVILAAPGDTIASYDSLAIGLRGAGFATILLSPRGSGRSVGPDCPLPSTWRGREEFLHSLVADDITAAFETLARNVRVDTTRYVVIASGGVASMATEAAARDRRVFLLSLMSPNPAAVDRGTMRTWAASRRMPMFLTTAPEDYQSRDLVERIYQATNRGDSRVVEARVPGTGAQTIDASADTRARMIKWLRESWTASTATRPTSPRK